VFRGRRYFYAVFVLHLAIEKALKGLYQHRLAEVPPKVHNLTYLLGKTGLVTPDAVGVFLMGLNSTHVVTRYPEDLATIQGTFPRKEVKEMLEQGKEALEWIRQQL